jgi:hypothetical protein
MKLARGIALTGQSVVETGILIGFGATNRLQTIGKQQFDLLLGLVRLLADSFTLFAIKVLQRPQEGNDFALSAEELDAKSFYLLS